MKTPMIVPAVEAGIGPTAAAPGVGAASAGGGQGAFGALLGMLLGVVPTVAPAIDAPPEPELDLAATERPAGDPAQAALFGFWLPQLAPAMLLGQTVQPAPTSGDSPAAAPLAGIAALGSTPSNPLAPLTAPEQPALAAAPTLATPPSGVSLPSAGALASLATMPTTPSGTAAMPLSTGTDAAPSPDIAPTGAVTGRDEMTRLVANTTRDLLALTPATDAPATAAAPPPALSTPARALSPGGEAATLTTAGTALTAGSDPADATLTAPDATAVALDAPTASASHPVHQSAPTSQAAAPTDAPADHPLSPTAIDEIVHTARVTTTPGRSSLRLHLAPAELGRIEVTIDLTSAGASIRLTAANPDAQAAIERQLPALRSALEASGFTADRLTIAADAFTAGLAGNAAFDLGRGGLPQRYGQPAPMPTFAGPGPSGTADPADERPAAITSAGRGLIDFRA